MKYKNEKKPWWKPVYNYLGLDNFCPIDYFPISQIFILRFWMQNSKFEIRNSIFETCSVGEAKIRNSIPNYIFTICLALRSTRRYDASIRQKHDMIQLSYNTSTRWSSNYAAVQSKGDSFQRMFRLTIADWLRRSEDSFSRQPSSVVIDGGYWAAE